MALTRAQCEVELLSRCGKLLTAASLDGVTANGSNPDLNSPLGYAIRMCGGTVADPSNVADSDLSTLSSVFDKLSDLAEYRTLENISGNLDLVDISEGPHRESLGQLAERVEKRLARLQEKLQKTYGLFLKEATLQVLSEYDE